MRRAAWTVKLGKPWSRAGWRDVPPRPTPGSRQVAKVVPALPGGWVAWGAHCTATTPASSIPSEAPSIDPNGPGASASVNPLVGVAIEKDPLGLLLRDHALGLRPCSYASGAPGGLWHITSESYVHVRNMRYASL
jgi:hypothetical protein